MRQQQHTQQYHRRKHQQEQPDRFRLLFSTCSSSYCARTDEKPASWEPGIGGLGGGGDGGDGGGVGSGEFASSSPSGGGGDGIRLHMRTSASWMVQVGITMPLLIIPLRISYRVVFFVVIVSVILSSCVPCPATTVSTWRLPPENPIPTSFAQVDRAVIVRVAWSPSAKPAK